MSLNLDYDYENDYVYCYFETGALKNLLFIKNVEELKKAEREITSLRLAKLLKKPILGNFDTKHLKKIHKYLFSDLYEWAGKFRTVNISKGNKFCRVEFIEKELDALFAELALDKALSKQSSVNIIAERLAYYLGEINAIHPFREGNGRSQRVFISYLAQKFSYLLDFSSIDPNDMIVASDEAFCGNYTRLTNLMLKVIRTI